MALSSVTRSAEAKRTQEMPLMVSNHNKEGNMSIMNHRFVGLGFEGLLNVNTMITIKRPGKTVCAVTA